jgi:hypothetical protein
LHRNNHRAAADSPALPFLGQARAIAQRSFRSLILHRCVRKLCCVIVAFDLSSLVILIAYELIDRNAGSSRQAKCISKTA